MQISIISASVRRGRLSHRVALGLQKILREQGEHAADILDLAAYDFPIMEETMKKMEALPDGLADFSEKIKHSDALIFVSPEYNGTYTAALKNALDALANQEFRRKVVAVSSVTTGPLGGMRAALAMQQLALAVGGVAIPDMLLVATVDKRFDESGALIDPAFEVKISGFLKSFLWTAEAVHAQRVAAV
jgi:NAD(P)H-dependent FMN reductase